MTLEQGKICIYRYPYVAHDTNHPCFARVMWKSKVVNLETSGHSIRSPKGKAMK